MTASIISKGILTGALFFGSGAFAQDISLSFPVDCTLGETCFIQQFMDHDATTGAADYACGSLTYDAHTGTDIRLRHRLDMQRGVAVLAAADGIVLGIRDGEVDQAQDTENAPDVTDKECGNGVLLDHGNGWQSQYCHLKQGSVTVRKGQRLMAGAPLGHIGLSGKTEFPHLHITLRGNGDLVDPFAPNAALCDPRQPQLWSPPIPYVAGGLLNAGFADNLPRFADIRAGADPVLTLKPDAPALVAWGLAYGLVTGDQIVLKLFDPNGALMVQDAVPLTRNRAVEYRAIGKRKASGTWQTGTYRATITILRNGAIQDFSEISLKVEN